MNTGSHIMAKEGQGTTSGDFFPFTLLKQGLS